MATSAVGPGFLTQTAVFTQQLGASFGFAILVSIVLDLGAQLTTWRVLVASNRRAQDVANGVLPGLGTLLALLVTLGGLAFNIGNVAGAGLGLNVLTGISPALGAGISAAIAIALFLVKEAGRAMDRFTQWLGLVMVALILYVAISSGPPVAEAARATVFPEHVDIFSIVTLVGGTVGGYITFAGAHRLLDAGIGGVEAVGAATRSAGQAIGIASLMRVLLFLAALGVVSSGATLDPTNPAASVFRLSTGEAGYRVFGVVMWAAAITSVVGAAYTSVSFLRSVSGWVDRAPLADDHRLHRAFHPDLPGRRAAGEDAGPRRLSQRADSPVGAGGDAPRRASPRHRRRLPAPADPVGAGVGGRRVDGGDGGVHARARPSVAVFEVGIARRRTTKSGLGTAVTGITPQSSFGVTLARLARAHTPMASLASSPPSAASPEAIPPELRELVQELAVAVHKRGIYPATHPMQLGAVEAVLTRLQRVLATRPELPIGVARSHLILDGRPTDPEHPLLSELAARLHDHQLGGVRFTPGVTREQLDSLVSALAESVQRGGEPLGARAAETATRWPNIVVSPVAFEQLALLDDEGAPLPSAARAARAAQAAELWGALAQAALVDGASGWGGRREAAAGAGARDRAEARHAPLR